ncbi:alcohol dehydrogenase [Phlyctema vagabunda]|uniref:Alcohol dehydrogenase n=1 Tax=Phlyctema vagabunda TaxID=108571 RepID=A0ABR4PAL9_9HELO
MKALVYNGVGKIAVEERPQPQIQGPSDAVVKLTHTTICGSDLHIIQGHVPTVPVGRILGHEGVGVIESVGPNVKSFKVGDHVVISCITTCDSCRFCNRGESGMCNSTGGWTLGHTNDGTQAEYVRIPHAEKSLHHAPKGIDERSLLVLSDILPTGLEVGVIKGGVKPGSSIAIIGAGPVGLSALITSQLYSPSHIVVIDRDQGRLDTAKKMGATFTINPDTAGDIKAATQDFHGEIDGFDVVIEAVGIPATFEACQKLVGKGGAIANVGVHGAKADLHLESLWGRGIRKLSKRR